MRRWLYPKDWEAISLRVRARSKGGCECTGECGLHRGKRCAEHQGQSAKWARGKIVLTVHHLDGNKAGRNTRHMKAMCQRCHLRADLPFHAERRKLAEDARTGQTRLPGMALLQVRP